MCEHGSEDEDNDEETDEAEGFTHDGEDGIVDGLGEIAGGLDGIADADAREATGADGEHGIVNMISGIGRFTAGKCGYPGVDTLHAVSGGHDETDGDDDGGQ